MPSDRWILEREAARSGYTRIAGVDEAGRGPLAGPVVSAAVILPEDFPEEVAVDSKKLTPLQRERRYGLIYERAVTVGVGIVDAVFIDRINILRASLASMAMAVDNLGPAPDFLLIDGIFPIHSSIAQRAVAGGDGRSVSIGAASIVAKVTRDRLMAAYRTYYPQFGFERHKGYPTRSHKAAIRIHGCSPIHRKTFRGVREMHQPHLWNPS